MRLQQTPTHLGILKSSIPDPIALTKYVNKFTHQVLAYCQSDST